jgi:hypothetical protein
MPDQYSVLTTPAFERDFRKASKGERSLWEYFSGKAEQKGIDMSELLTNRATR